ncbi:hypothetical protein C8R32_101214 [Nitrosospira sp. Nsp5]|uniref:Uncharacterized protein n=1 Tax=Nitrosospira multiformis TaxID=1231 RepID=A0ABY0TG28_9PROT|nr:hypothetical protein C8R32_101214 [Nitrosospira sp. Nsp5]SDQ77779.1 hypothetical protein SAMN05216402_2247 [Nitrosospira multiformis]
MHCFWGTAQGAATRNTTAQGGAVPSAGRCDPEAGGRPMHMERDRGIPYAGPAIYDTSSSFPSRHMRYKTAITMIVTGMMTYKPIAYPAPSS